VSDVLDVAEPGTAVRGRIFRTDAMPFGAFVAVTVTIGESTYRLRGENLQPTWASATGRGGPAGGGAARDDRRCWWDLPSFNCGDGPTGGLSSWLCRRATSRRAVRRALSLSAWSA
jgi:hypothetical protein